MGKKKNCESCFPFLGHECGTGSIDIQFQWYVVTYSMLLVLLLSRFSCVRLWRPHRRQPTRLPCPWDSPGKNTGVGCHFLLQCMKVKSESEVTQSCPTLSDPMDCSPPGSSIHGIFQARVLEWGAIAFSIDLYISFKLQFFDMLTWEDIFLDVINI